MRPFVSAIAVLALGGALAGCEKRAEQPAGTASAPASAAYSKTASGEADTPFSELTFDAACQKARQEGKLVLIDFYTTWCGPCKMLDKQTWRDETVGRWLRAKTVALKVDADKQKELAARYGVKAYPTIVFLKADGREMDRLLGFRPPEDFLKDAADIAAGVDRAQAIREELKKAGNDPMQRQELAGKLAELRKYPEALDELLWCFDHGTEHAPSYAGVRLSFLVGEIARLCEDYPPALAALRERRDKSRVAVLGGSGSVENAAELAALNGALGEDAQTLEVYDGLAESDWPQKEQLRRAMSSYVFEGLLEAKRYGEILSITDVDQAVDMRIASYQQAALHQDADGKAMLGALRQYVVDECGRYYEVLLGGQKNDAAAKLAERLFEFDPSADTLVKLISFAAAAGELEPARALVKSKLEAVPEAERSAVQAALLVNEYFALVSGAEKPADAAALGQQAAAALGTEAERLNEFAWRVLTDEKIKSRDLELALRVAKAAYDACGGQDAEILDTYARALWDNGSKKPALEVQRQAIKLATENGDEQAAAELKQTLARYEGEGGN